MIVFPFILALAHVLVDSTPLSLDVVVERLDSPLWVEREAATYEVAHISSGITTNQIEARLQQGGLSLEQVVRLLRAVEIRLLHSPRGAVGIQMAPIRRPADGDLLRIDRIGVEIMAVIPNMPAEGLIKPGDVITHIEGVVLRTQEDLARVVQRHWPGDVLPFRILRTIPNVDGGEPETVEVNFDLTLGSTDVLSSSGTGMTIRDPGHSARVTEVHALHERFGPVPTRVPTPAKSGGVSISSREHVEDQVVAGALQLLAAVEAGRSPLSLAQARAGWLETITRTEAMLAAAEMEPEQRQRLRLRLERLRAIYDSTAP